MRGAAARRVSRRVRPGALLTASIGSGALAGCTLGVVDLGPDPSAARMYVHSEVVPHPSLRGRVLVTVEAELDPGIGPSGTPRGFVSDALTVDGASGEATEPNAAGYSSWQAFAEHDAPGPIAVELRFPWLEELPPPTTIDMRVQIPVPPEDTVVVAEGEDLVILADPPTSPFQNLEAMEWELRVTAPAPSPLLIVTGARGGWPREMRVPAARFENATFPLRAHFRLRWRRSLVLSELTPTDRLDLTLESDMQTEWTVVRAPTP